MSAMNNIRIKITEAEKVVEATQEHFGKIYDEYLKAKDAMMEARTSIYDLHINLQELEAMEEMRQEHNQLVMESEAEASRPIGTKYKWTHKTNPETYRVAIQTKDGVLQVKSVTDGAAEVHEDCGCSPCWEFENNAPWRLRKPLTKTLFADLVAWDATLPYLAGKLVITSAPITDKVLKALCLKPLDAKMDAHKLNELEERFPGGVFVLSTPGKQFVIKSRGTAIYSVNPNIVCLTFMQFGGENKPHLMVEWRGLYIDLSHLF